MKLRLIHVFSAMIYASQLGRSNNNVPRGLRLWIMYSHPRPSHNAPNKCLHHVHQTNRQTCTTIIIIIILFMEIYNYAYLIKHQRAAVQPKMYVHNLVPRPSNKLTPQFFSTVVRKSGHGRPGYVVMCTCTATEVT